MEGSNAFDSISEVIPGFLYIGGMNAPTRKEFLLDRGVSFALNVSDDVPRAPVDHYRQIKVADTMTEDLRRYFGETNDFISRAKAENAGILIYDLTGVSRAPAFALAWLMANEKLLLKEGLYIIKNARQWMNINSNFMIQLVEEEKKLFQVNSIRVIHEDREKKRFETIENFELPETEADAEKKKKKKKKKEKKTAADILGLKTRKKEPEIIVKPKARLKADKFAWSNEDVYTEGSARDSKRMRADEITDYRDKKK